MWVELRMKILINFSKFLNPLENLWMGCKSMARAVHCDNIRKQRVGKYKVIYIHKRKILKFS